MAKKIKVTLRDLDDRFEKLFPAHSMEGEEVNVYIERLGKEGIVFDPSTGKLNTQAPVRTVGVEGDFLVSYWVGNALIRNGYRPAPIQEGIINVNCISSGEILLTLPGGAVRKLEGVAALVEAVKEERIGKEEKI